MAIVFDFGHDFSCGTTVLRCAVRECILPDALRNGFFHTTYPNSIFFIIYVVVMMVVGYTVVQLKIDLTLCHCGAVFSIATSQQGGSGIEAAG